MTHQALNDPETRRIFEEEVLIGEATENVSALLGSVGLSQRELAGRLGVSEARVSQILSGKDNLTLRSLASLGWALGIRFELEPTSMSRQERLATPAADDPPAPDWLRRLRPRAKLVAMHVPSPKEVAAGRNLTLVGRAA